MNIISQRSFATPQRGPINNAGFLDPQGNPYPVNDTTHAQWMLEHIDWLVSKGYELPSSVEMMGEISKHQTANVRNILVKQGWIVIQRPHIWHVRSIPDQANKVEDAVLSGKVKVKNQDYPIEIFEVDTHKMVKVDKEQLYNTGISEEMTRPQIFGWLRKKHGFTKEALRNMQENVVMFKQVVRNVSGDMQHWIIVDAYDISNDKDLAIKFNLTLMECGFKKDGEFYDRQLNHDNPNQEYQQLIEKIAHTFKQMVGPAIEVIPEKEFGRDDRSAIYVAQKKETDDFM